MKLIRGVLAVLFLGTALNATTVLAAEGGKTAEKAAPKDIVLKGDAKCTSCHDEADGPEVLRIGKTKHGVVADGRNPTCTNCHGESKSHVEYKGSDKPPKPEITFGKKTKTDVAARNEACLSCHQGGNRNGWQTSAHGTQDVACTSCHQVHNQHDKVRGKTSQAETCFSCHKEQRNQVNKASHHPIVEGKMTCSSCHNVHGDNPKHLVKASTNETCYTCHMEKRGPFVHNHQPVTEDCGICHQPHGTNAPNLLKARAPFICQECHASTGHATGAATLPTSAADVSGTRSQAGGRQCMNCHTNIHGSNSIQKTSGGRFIR
jgi:DmsE family decaheme c-type cytochrome